MTEEQEQIQFINWLNAKYIKHSAIPNSTYTTSWNQKRKNVAMGTTPGVPDIMLIVQCHDGKKRLIMIEMKKAKAKGKRGGMIGGGKVSKAQKDWINAINQCEECEAFVAYGCKEAKQIVRGLETGKNIPETISF